MEQLNVVLRPLYENMASYENFDVYQCAASRDLRFLNAEQDDK